MIRLAALLLALQSCAPAIAEEITGVDPTQVDKQAHFLAGSTIAAGVIAIENRYAAEWPFWLKTLVPIAAASVVGEIKELADKHSAHHTSDVRDWRATTAGGACATICLTWTF